MSKSRFGNWNKGLAVFCLSMAGMLPIAHAARIVNSATVDGTSVVAVAGGATISVNLSVTTSSASPGNNDWESTGWRIATTAPGAVTCVNHGDYTSSGTYDETFNVTAPVADGVYNLYLIAYEDDACSANASATFTLSGPVLLGAPRVHP